jgi:hypothetical protein
MISRIGICNTLLYSVDLNLCHHNMNNNHYSVCIIIVLCKAGYHNILYMCNIVNCLLPHFIILSSWGAHSRFACEDTGSPGITLGQRQRQNTETRHSLSKVVSHYYSSSRLYNTSRIQDT